MTEGQRSIIVTGGSGFVGAYVARALAQRDCAVHIVDVKEPSAEIQHVLRTHLPDITFYRCGVDDASQLEKVFRQARPTHVVHAAAIVDPARLATDPRPALDVNVAGTVNVLQTAGLSEVERLVYVSSIGVLPTVQFEPITVDHPIVLAREGPGAGFYGAAKAASEAFCLAAVGGLGVDTRIVRPSAVYGLGMQWPIYIKPMIERTLQSLPVHFDHGGPFPRDYTHADDVASLVVALLDAPDDADRVFYAATGRPLTTTAELAEVVTRIVPEARITVADRLSDEDLLERAYRGRLSIRNATEQVGWQPYFADIEDGVRHYIDQYRSFLAG